MIQITAAHAGQRIDNYLLTHLKGVPRSLIYRILRQGEVRLNKRRVKPSDRLTAGDWLRIPPVRCAAANDPPTPSARLQALLDAAVLYEDDRLLVLNKPAGLAVHGGSGISAGVIETLRVMRPRIELELVHRLDRDTSGCLLVSKRRSTLRWLHEQLRDGQMTKQYQALLLGRLPQVQTRVTVALRKNQLRSGERVVTVDPLHGKPAETLFGQQQVWVQSTSSGQSPGQVTLAQVTLATGRTHQIRVHAAHLGAPVAGDEKYGDAAGNQQLRALGLTRLFLHAALVRFQPSPEAAAVTVTAPLPEALAAVLARLG
ncbi:RluA family pseudouridine synthase [Thiospirillum jenense]|uniref:Pseudouridine synthase n=2 Tax=Thiospirillum jenense TaxID=1653858 RepID=A0A839HGK3_9GAMM|nr:RluA family pseudouridine synthase [Thiospirillum jenense]MBB1126248.1 RluA family pseudouridine synthase [Thiospirillum jenense]